MNCRTNTTLVTYRFVLKSSIIRDEKIVKGLTILNIEHRLILFYSKLSVWNLVLRHMKKNLTIFLVLTLVSTICALLILAYIVPNFVRLSWFDNTLFCLIAFEIAFLINLKYFLFPQAVKKSRQLYHVSFYLEEWRVLIYATLRDFLKKNNTVIDIFFLIKDFKEKKKELAKSFKKKVFYKLSLCAFILFVCIWISFNFWFFDHIISNHIEDAFLYLILSFICLLLLVVIAWCIHHDFDPLFPHYSATLANLIRILENIELAQNNERFGKIIDTTTAHVDPEMVRRIIIENTYE